MDPFLAVTGVVGAGFIALGILWAATKSEGKWLYDERGDDE